MSRDIIPPHGNNPPQRPITVSTLAVIDYRYDFAVRSSDGGKTIRVFAPDLYTASRLCIDRWQETTDSSRPNEPVRPYIILVATDDPQIRVAPPNSNVIPFPLRPPVRAR